MKKAEKVQKDAENSKVSLSNGITKLQDVMAVEDKKEVKLEVEESLVLENLQLKALLIQKDFLQVQMSFQEKAVKYNQKLNELQKKYGVSDKYGFDADKQALLFIIDPNAISETPVLESDSLDVTASNDSYLSDISSSDKPSA